MTTSSSHVVEIRYATDRDVRALEWNGLFTAHRALIERAYRRHRRGTVAMLVADSGGEPIAQAWIDFVRRRHSHTALIWAVRVLPQMQGRGLGTLVMDAAEALIADRVFRVAEVGVEKPNVRARTFYERRGYQCTGQLLDESTFTSPDGTLHRLQFDQWILRKTIAGPCVAPGTTEHL